jgi:hypothetical protein
MLLKRRAGSIPQYRMFSKLPTSPLITFMRRKNHPNPIIANMGNTTATYFTRHLLLSKKDAGISKNYKLLLEKLITDPLSNAKL